MTAPAIAISISTAISSGRGELVNVRQRDVYIIQPLVPPTQEHLMELLLMIDAARGASAGGCTHWGTPSSASTSTRP